MTTKPCTYCGEAHDDEDLLPLLYTIKCVRTHMNNLYNEISELKLNLRHSEADRIRADVAKFNAIFELEEHKSKHGA